MARSNHLPINQLTKSARTVVIGDQCIIGENSEDPKVLSKKSRRTWWATCKNIFLSLYHTKKQLRINRATHRYLPTLCDYCLNDIGVTFHLQMPDDHRLRVISTYKAAKPHSIPDTPAISDKSTNDDAIKGPIVPSKKASNSRWAVCINLLIRVYQAKRQQLIDRAAFRHLLKLNDSGLKDIGVTRENVIWASRQPLFVSASLELEKIARNNRKNYDNCR